MKKIINGIEGEDQYQIWKQLESDDTLEKLSTKHRRGYEKMKSNVNKEKDNLQALNDYFIHGHQRPGHVFSASGFKHKNFSLGKDGEKLSHQT
jgi:hypothetical protein